MSFNQHFLEKNNIIPAIMPVNLATGANNGDWISMKDYGRCAIVFVGAVGAAAQDPTITLLQGKTSAGGSSKALNFTRVDYKQATALTSVGAFTNVTQVAGNTYTNGTMGELQKLVVIDIMADDLDIANDFDWIQLSIDDLGSTSAVGAALYILHEPRYAGGGVVSQAIV